MKSVKGFTCFIVVVLVLSAATSAYATAYTLSNSLSIRVDVAMVYVDADSGVLTTEGWWQIEPGSEIFVNVHADESHDVYYAAYNKKQYFDSNTTVSPNIKRWVSPRAFTYTTDNEPNKDDAWKRIMHNIICSPFCEHDEDNDWLGTFYKINGESVNIDTNETPLMPPEQSTTEIETKTQGKVTESPGTDVAGDTENYETLGDKLSTEYLSDKDLSTASKGLLSYLRNRIYANHGYVFKNPKIRDLFSKYDWYKPNPDFSTGSLNEYERENLKRIIAEEKSR